VETEKPLPTEARVRPALRFAGGGDASSDGEFSAVSSSSNSGDKEFWTDEILDFALLTLPPCESRGRFPEETDLGSSSSEE
jgi:hypothetical protein